MTSDQFFKLSGKKDKKAGGKDKDPSAVPKGTRCTYCEEYLDGKVIVTSLMIEGFYCGGICIDKMREEEAEDAN